jgi:two-component system response regulator WspF
VKKTLADATARLKALGAPRERLVAIGASAGGPAALATLLAGPPGDFPAAIVIVQHVDERFADGMAQWLSRDCPLPVRVAKEGDRPEPGTVLLAATNDHLKFKSAGRIGYTPDPVAAAYRPSVDVFFESAGALWRGELVGVLLTGMGRDGAKGLKLLRDKGCYTIAQDEDSSAVYGMPKAAANLGAAVDILPLVRIAPRLIETFKQKS